MRQIKFYLEEELYRLLKERAEARGVSVSSLVREIVVKELTSGVDSERLEKLEKELERLKQSYKKLVEAFNKLVKDYKATKECIIKLHGIQWELYCK